MKEKSQINELLVNISSTLAVLLPLIQLAFIYLPEGLTRLYVLPDTFLGASLITLMMSYISIIAFKTRPWSPIVLPFHKKQFNEYNDWQRRLYEVKSTLDAASKNQINDKLIKNYLDLLEKKSIKKPFQIDSENRVSILMVLLFISVLGFLIIGLNYSTGWLAIIQPVLYFFTIIISVLVLVIYRDTAQNSKRYSDLVAQSSQKAIELAIEANCFQEKPQVKFISTHGGEGISDVFVRVEFKSNQYEIRTNYEVTKLIYCFKLD